MEYLVEIDKYFSFGSASWVTISPASQKIKGGSSCNFTINCIPPEDIHNYHDDYYFPIKLDAYKVNNSNVYETFYGPAMVLWVDSHPPEKPYNINIYNLKYNKFNISWGFCIDNYSIKKYTVEVYLNGTKVKTVSTIDEYSNTLLIDGLTQCNNYDVYIIAEDKAGYTTKSDKIVVSTPSSLPNEVTLNSDLSGTNQVVLALVAVHLVEGFKYISDGSHTFRASIGGCSGTKSSMTSDAIDTYENSLDTDNEVNTNTIYVEHEYKGMNISSISNTKVDIYPNPNDGTFTISGLKDQDNASIEVLNMMGKVVYSRQSRSVEEVIDISGQPDGVYFVKIVSGGRVITERIVKQ